MTNDGARAYTWDEENRLIQVRDMQTDEILVKNKYEGQSRRRETAGGILGGTTASASVFYHYDGNGKVVATTDESGDIVSRLEYAPFGRILLSDGNNLPRFQFSSKEYDETTGLNYYGYRFYSPEMGRWPNRDPINELSNGNYLTLPDSIEKRGAVHSLFYPNNKSDNRHFNPIYEVHCYNYSVNDPVGKFDILGLKTCDHRGEYPGAYKCKCPSKNKPGKRHKDNYNKVADGCSNPLLPGGGKNNPSGWCSFEDVCNVHDCCYGSCNSVKSACDGKFFNQMADACEKCAAGSGLMSAIIYRDCMKWAHYYYAAVSSFGQGAYDDNQKNACEECCCSE